MAWEKHEDATTVSMQNEINRLVGRRDHDRERFQYHDQKRKLFARRFEEATTRIAAAEHALTEYRYRFANPIRD